MEFLAFLFGCTDPSLMCVLQNNGTHSAWTLHSLESAKGFGGYCTVFGRAVQESVCLRVGKRLRCFRSSVIAHGICPVRNKVPRNWKMVEGERQPHKIEAAHERGNRQYL